MHIAGSVSKTYNSINPATLSGAIDVIVIEQENGDLACSPFHVRFGKFSLLRPLEKKASQLIPAFPLKCPESPPLTNVEFRVNGHHTNFPMKLGEGGEAFFVFETSSDIPEDLQTSPLVSPAASPRPMSPVSDGGSLLLESPETFDLETSEKTSSAATSDSVDIPRRAKSDIGSSLFSLSPPEELGGQPKSEGWKYNHLDRSTSADVLPADGHKYSLDDSNKSKSADNTPRSSSPLSVDPLRFERAKAISEKISIPTRITDDGDLMLDMNGYKTSVDDSLGAEVIARDLLRDELEFGYEIASLVGVDSQGNIIIYTSEEAKIEADRRIKDANAAATLEAISDAESGYQSDDGKSMTNDQLATPPKTPPPGASPLPLSEPKNYAKTLRLTSTQLKSLNLRPGANTLSFSVNKAVCNAYLYLWKWNVPIVISDIDGTITKSDALGHFYNMLGRDWTHSGVAKLFTDISANGYNIIYLTSRSVGQADTTRNYLNGIVQDKYKLPKGPVIMSPDRTLAALRREVYLRKPEVFKMACLRDILSLFGDLVNPFYAGFGNRLTDALSYRSVNVPSTRIYTIDSNGSVILDLLTLTTYKSSYVNMRDDVDHFFPPVTNLNPDESYTDFNYWRAPTGDFGEFSDSEDEGGNDDDDDDEDVNLDAGEEYYEDDLYDEGQYDDTLGDSYLSQASTRPDEQPNSELQKKNAEFDEALRMNHRGRVVERLLEKDKMSRAAGQLKAAYGDNIPEPPFTDAGAEHVGNLHVADPRVLEAQDDIFRRENLGTEDDSGTGMLHHMAEVVENYMGIDTEQKKPTEPVEETSA
ncbi:Lipin-3 [Drechslerella dactyloides]|uniref:Lipin-3 n=1 Tax=Drechslerella dactyloides TaxID=74499 RepID=A0AAD6NM76_DREDA|nr:Lipin-3 [Drechslerella dactyloides]